MPEKTAQSIGKTRKSLARGVQKASWKWVTVTSQGREISISWTKGSGRERGESQAGANRIHHICSDGGPCVYVARIRGNKAQI